MSSWEIMLKTNKEENFKNEITLPEIALEDGENKKLRIKGALINSRKIRDVSHSHS